MKKIQHTWQTENMAVVKKDQMNWNQHVNRTQNNRLSEFITLYYR